MNRFRQKFYFLLTALILLTMLISLSFSYYFSYDNQLKQLESQMHQTVDDKTGYMGEWLSGKMALMELIPSNNIAREPLSAETLKQHGISDIYEGYEDGGFLSLTGWLPPKDYDPRVRPWYKTIINNNQLTISDPYMDLNSKEMSVSVGRPILENGKIVGVRAADILISTIINEISQLNFGEIGFVWIINERGNFIYHPDESIINKNIYEVSGISGIPSKEALSDGGEVRYIFNGSKRTALFRKIPNSEWILGVTVLDNRAFSNLERLKSLYLILSIVLSCIFGVTSYVLTRILAAPIIRIISFVDGISKGNLDQTLELHFNKEIDALAVSLNDMSLKLKKSFSQIEAQKQALSTYNSELEALVKMRTQDIEAANEKLKASNEALEKQATTDYLTGISNRRSFFEMAYKEVCRSDREASPLCLIIVDLDDFKHVNDQYGHAAGDEILVQTTLAMGECLRTYDLLGRLGGEEFVILLPETSEVQGLEIGERIRKKIEAAIIVFEDQSISVTVSMGLVVRESTAYCLEKAISQADEALYEAKRSGKNKVVVYHPTK